MNMIIGIAIIAVMFIEMVLLRFSLLIIFNRIKAKMSMIVLLNKTITINSSVGVTLMWITLKAFVVCTYFFMCSLWKEVVLPH